MFNQALRQFASGRGLWLLWSEVLNADPVQTTGWRFSLLLYKVSEGVLILEFSDFLDLTRIVEDHVRKTTIVVFSHVLFFGGRLIARLRTRPGIIICVLQLRLRVGLRVALNVVNVVGWLEVIKRYWLVRKVRQG